MEVINVSICDTTYNLRCQKEEKNNLINSVNYLNNLINQIKISNKNQSNERIVVMAALQLSSELCSAANPNQKNNMQNHNQTIIEIKKYLNLINNKLDSI
ncbi:cell division protein ZapA [Candidatus Kinetoplastibacterium sorsogonicusi]|nr:cell division protein ZapA [Candidatus Kinetoplastibacterium sorsogonicusi]